MNAVVLRNFWVIATSLLVLIGCYSSERPSAAGTNTSWLNTCETSADCDAPMECIGGFCAYGSGIAPTAVATPPVGPASSGGQPTAPASTESQPAPPASAEGAPPASPWIDGFDAQGRILISDLWRHAGAPRLGFIDGRFIVAYSSSPWPDRPTSDYAGPQLNVAEVSDAGIGSIWTQKPARAESHQIAAIAADGRIGALPYSSASCALEIFQPRLIGAFPRFLVDCADDLVGLAPIAGSLEWIVAHGDGDTVYVGRYDPSAETWTVPALAIGDRRSATVLGVTVDGEDALVAWNAAGSTTHLRSARGLAALAAANGPDLGPLLSFAGEVQNDGQYNFAALEDRLLVLGMDGGSLWAASLAASDESPAVASVASSGVVDRRPGIAAAAELGLAGVCYATGPGPAGGSAGRDDGVAFALIDAEGRLAGEPRQLAAELDNLGGCDIAWSGEAFLVAWWDIDLAADPAVSVVRGQRIADF